MLFERHTIAMFANIILQVFSRCLLSLPPPPPSLSGSDINKSIPTISPVSRIRLTTLTEQISVFTKRHEDILSFYN